VGSPDAPICLRQGGRYRFFFTNIRLEEPDVREKSKKSTLLPPAKPALHLLKRLV